MNILKIIILVSLQLFISNVLFGQNEGYTFQVKKDTNLVSIDQLLELLGSAKPIQGKTLVMNEIHFGFGKAVLNNDAKTYLSKVVRLLDAMPGMNLTIEGHTDNVGDSDANLKLSEDRALSVYAYLMQHGIVANRITYAGYGDTRPIADNNTNLGREQNRRVEFRIVQNELKGKNENLYDQVHFNDGTKIGAYNVEQKGDALYYTRFSDGMRVSVPMDLVLGYYLTSGYTYQRTPTTSNLPLSSKTDDYFKPTTTLDESSFFYRFRYVDFFYGINISRMTTNTDYVNDRNWFGRAGIGFDFFHDLGILSDSTRRMYKLNQFFIKTRSYLRCEVAFSNMGGIFRDRLGFYQDQDLYLKTQYFESTFLMQFSLVHDHLNVYTGPSFMFRYDEDYQAGYSKEKDTRISRVLDIPWNIGIFLRSPYWEQDFKLGFRWSFGTFDATRSKNDDGYNVFAGERNFTRNFAIILKYGI